MSEKNN